MQMKKLIVFFVAFVATFFGVNSFASSEHLMAQNILDVVEFPYNVIDWKKGDSANFDVTLGSFLKGTLVKTVTKIDDDANAIWVNTKMDLSIQKDESDMLISRADGKVLKFIHNGKEEAAPSGDIEVVSQDYTEIDVPAGHFKAIHIVANTKDVKGIEVWANPRDTVMEGTLKQTVPSQFGNIEIVLARFHHAGTIQIDPLPCGFVGCPKKP
jgi:hypothetical protein